MEIKTISGGITQIVFRILLNNFETHEEGRKYEKEI